MINDLSAPRAKILSKGGLDSRQSLIKSVELIIDILFRIVEKTRRLRIDHLLNDLRQKCIRSREQVTKFQAVLLHVARMSCLDYCEALAMQDGRYRSAENSIDLAVLREICDLRATPEITDRGKQKILYDRTEHHAGTEPLRLCLSTSQ